VNQRQLMGVGLVLATKVKMLLDAKGAVQDTERMNIVWSVADGTYPGSGYFFIFLVLKVTATELGSSALPDMNLQAKWTKIVHLFKAVQQTTKKINSDYIFRAFA
tara:strand:- start:6837 stop:7151 length:315 start_codon:yes stop_codon:yes gene_type:complete